MLNAEWVQKRYNYLAILSEKLVKEGFKQRDFRVLSDKSCKVEWIYTEALHIVYFWVVQVKLDVNGLFSYAVLYGPKKAHQGNSQETQNIGEWKTLSGVEKGIIPKFRKSMEKFKQ